MFLKALTLKGFKSFADTAVLELQPGITVIVGPNGSGKSNVVDAVGWVLGAQAPSAVRSQRMDDVIFAGTATRPALGRAEVSLTIDNETGLLPLDLSEITVTRTLWRSGDSEYAINGVACRLLDVQELFSDTGVGRQQHVIVGQGQIDAVLNARPEERRAVIEEAAGILKHRKRKERSERRLAATEGNLLRLTDLVREVRRQLKPLERQAEAARRHGDLLAELRALQVFLVGRDLATLKRRLGDTTAAGAEVRGEDALLRERLTGLDTTIAAAEARLGPLGGSSLSDALGQLEALRERARGQLAIMAERRRGIERERATFVDQAVVASLEAEAARLRGELAQASADAEALAPEAAAVTAEEDTLAEQRRDLERGDEEAGPPPAAGRAGQMRGELAVLRDAVDRAQADLARSEERRGDLRDRLRGLDDEAAQAEERRAQAEAATPELAESLAAAERRRGEAREVLEAAERRSAEATARQHASAARVEALSLALDDARARVGAEHLAEVDGVLGVLLELVDIDPGWEAAVEAACGEALAAVVVASPDAGRRALGVLARGDTAGGVLALGAAPVANAEPPPSAGEPVRAHVRSAHPGVDSLLDAVLGGAVAVDGRWEAALDVALAHPDLTVVTPEGARFGVRGWRLATATTGATGAALEAARRDTAAAEHDAAEAAAAQRDAQAALSEATAAEAAAADRLEAARRTQAAAAAERERLAGLRHEISGELEALAARAQEATERLSRDQPRVTELERELPVAERAEATGRQRAQAASEARRQLDTAAGALAARRRDLDVRAAALTDRQAFLRQRLAETETRLEGSVAERRQAEARRIELEQREQALVRLSGFVGARLELVDERLAQLRTRRREETELQRAISRELDDARRSRGAAERSLAELRERAQRIEIEEAELRLRLEQTVEACRSRLDVEPEVAEGAEAPELPTGVTPTVRVHELERELRVMGPINPLALEEYEALAERHRFLHEQLDDVKATRRELAKVIRAVDEEIVRVFAAAYADVSQNFEQLFATLFPGGRGRLQLTDPDDPLNCGVEVEAKPSGKNVKKLTLLSGGERSLTALAYLFAVFRSRPSPFYVLDEVEAALDDVNLRRFLDLVAEFRDESQLAIVTHQKRTMEAADALFGVTMAPGGSSKIISEAVGARA